MTVRRYEDPDQPSVASLDVDTEVETFADVQLRAGTFSWQERPSIPPDRIDHRAGLLINEPPCDQAVPLLHRSWKSASVRATGHLDTGIAHSRVD